MAEFSYETILRKGNCVLVDDKAGRQYIVGIGYDPKAPMGQQWGHGHYFSYWADNERKTDMAMAALDYLFSRTVKGYISKSRLEEIATSALHELKETDEDSFTDFCENDLDLTDEEKEWFGLNDGEEDEDDE
jgi:hypothetical protein